MNNQFFDPKQVQQQINNLEAQQQQDNTNLAIAENNLKNMNAEIQNEFGTTDMVQLQQFADNAQVEINNLTQQLNQF